MKDLYHLQETLVHAILNERFIPSTRNTRTCYIK